MDRKTLNELYGLAMSEDWSTDDLCYRQCQPTELSLFAEMCIAAAYDTDGDCALTETQLKHVREVGQTVGIPPQHSGRFFRRVCDIAKRRKLSVNSLIQFWRGMRTECQE